MEYYQYIQYIYQQSNPQIQKIIEFESYKTPLNFNDGYLISFPQNEYICLEELIESIKAQYVIIYIGQAIIIANRILIHLKQLFDELKITHGDLSIKNIYISLTTNSDKFNIINPFLEINKIHFVNYQLVNQEQFTLNRVKDQKDIKIAIINLLSLYQTNNLIKKLIDKLNDSQGIGGLISLLKQFQMNHLDINSQKLNNCELTINYNQRQQYLKKIEGFYINFYQQHKVLWSNYNKNIAKDQLFQSEMIKICKLILVPNLKRIMGIFQYEIVQSLDYPNQHEKLEQIFQAMYKTQIDQMKELNHFLETIQSPIDIVYQKQLSFQQQLKEKCSIELNILTKDRIASAYHKQLAYQLSKNDYNKMEESKNLLLNIKSSLEQSIQQYLDQELKIQILEFMNHLI